jgi:WD40 repeat protein
MKPGPRNQLPIAKFPGADVPQSRMAARSKVTNVLAMALASLLCTTTCGAPPVPLPEDFLAPRLVLNGQGHTATTWSLVFSPDGKYLFSGGTDKVVHVWEFRDGRPRLDRSIRPPIRRTTGVVLAIAISPVLDRQEQRLVAIAGRSTLGSGGQILVYRFPGRADRPAGDLAFALPDQVERRSAVTDQHQGAVFGVAFSWDGRYFASCGEDKTVRIWDLADAKNQHPNVVVLDGAAGHKQAVRGVAFLDNQRLISVGGNDADGTIRVWDWQKPQPLINLVPTLAEIGTRVNALAVSPDGQQVVVGRENGELGRYDPVANAMVPWFNEEDRGQLRPIEALAFSPDGRQLAVSSLTYVPPQRPSTEYPRTECTISVRAMPEGRVIRVVRTTKDLARAMAFRPPDGRFLAVGGGEAQEIAITDMRADPSAAAIELRGPGTVLWDVGFVDGASKPTVAYTRNRPLGREQPTWEGFDLPLRRFLAIDQAQPTDRAITRFGGWSIATPRADRITVSSGNERPVTLQLTPTERRWCCFTLIPPAPEQGRTKLTAAVGTEEGYIVIYSLPDGRRTRVLAGHAGAVRALAPSRDGRWLATASADQTVRLWSLSGCDTRASLGAKIERAPTGKWVVTSIVGRSPAQQMGLKVGDAVLKVSSKNKKGTGEIVTEDLPIDDLDARLAAIEPGVDAQIVIDLGRPKLSTNRFDQPSLSLLPGSDKEWIVWMPEGIYDTSIAGDRRLLGWHVNKVDAANPNDFIPLSSEFYPMSRFEGQLHKPAVINRVLQTGDVIAGLGPVVVEPPPTIRIVQPANVAPGAELVVPRPTLTLSVEAAGGSPNRGIKSIVVHNNTAFYPQTLLDRPAPKAEATHEIKLVSNENAISVVATDDLGVEQIARMRVRLELPPAPPANAPGPRLLIRSVGIDTFDDVAAIKPIRFARTDAITLADFLEAPDKKERFNRIDNAILASGRTTSQDLGRVFESLSNEVRDRKLGVGDTVFLVIETHLIKRGSKGLVFLGSDASLQYADQPAIEAKTISHCLEEVAAAGCLVFVLLDGIHQRELSIAATQEITAWVRDLNRRQVFVLVASKQEISQRPAALGMSAFVRSIKDSVTVAGGSRSGARLTVDEFRVAVIRGVAERTSRSQFADLYAPDILDQQLDRIRLFEPQGRAGDRLACIEVNGPAASRLDALPRPGGTTPTQRRPE